MENRDTTSFHISSFWGDLDNVIDAGLLLVFSVNTEFVCI